MGLFDWITPGSPTKDTDTTRTAIADDYEPETDVDLGDVSPSELTGASSAAITSEQQYEDPETEWIWNFKPMPGRSGRVMRGGHEFKIRRDSEEDTLIPDPETIFAGAWPRAMIRNHEYNPDQPVALGIDSYNDVVWLPKEETFRHVLALGETGSGKTTVWESFANQIFATGHGGVAVDPGGEAAVNMIQQMPQERIDNDDVVMLDVGADYLDKRVGFNLLDTYNDPGDDGFSNELENRVADIVPLMNADEYARMRGIAEHVLRGLIEADYSAANNGESTAFGEKVNEYLSENEEHEAGAEKNNTIQDMFHIISTKENREAWFEMVKDLGIHRLTVYASQLAELDDDDNKLEPLIRRLRTWMENENVRPIVSQRTTTISIPEIVKEGKILIVKCNEAPDKVREIITGAISRMVWSVCMARPSSENEYIKRRLSGEDPESIEITSEEQPFYLMLDEIHSLIGKDTKIVDMLAEARKKKLGLFLSTQQLNQLPSGESGNNVQERVVSNTATTLAFHPGDDSTEQNAVASAFQGRDSDDIMVDPYHATVAITDGSGQTAEPLVAEMFPPVPSRRTIEGVVQILQDSYEKYGVEPKSELESLMSVPSRFNSAIESLAEANNDGALKLTERRKRCILAVLFSLMIDRDDPSEPITTNALTAALDDDPMISVENNHIDTLVQRANSRELINVSPDGSTVEITDDGRETLWDSGQAGNAGYIGHQAPMEYIARSLSEMGYTTRVPRQNGEEMPDLYATLPVEPGGNTFEEAKEAREELRTEHPNIWELSGESDVAVEFEKATMSAPSQIGHNLRKAVEQDDPDHVLFVVNEAKEDGESFADLARRLSEKLTEPMLVYSRTPNGVYRRFHHQDDRLLSDQNGPQIAVRGGDANYQWVDDSSPDESPSIVLRVGDDNGGYREVARFDSLKEWRDRDADDFPVSFSVNDGQVTVSENIDGSLETYADETAMYEDYTAVFAPFIPEEQFDDGLPDSDAWDIAILPNDEDLPLQYYDPEQDTAYPLTDLGEGGTGSGSVETMGGQNEGSAVSGVDDENDTSDDGDTSESLRERLNRIQSNDE
jgi:hypothetical protein